MPSESMNLPELKLIEQIMNLNAVHFIEGIYVALTVILMLTIRRLSDNKQIILRLPGTIIHEFLHYITGLFLLAEPVKFSVWPKKGPNGEITLGYVEFRNFTWYNTVIVSLAPLLIIPITIFLIVVNTPYGASVGDLYGTTEFLSLLGITISMSVLSTEALPSTADIAVIFENTGSMIAVSVLAAYYLITTVKPIFF